MRAGSNRTYTDDLAAARRREEALEAALHGNSTLRDEVRERYAGVVAIERGPAAYRVTFPALSAAERGTPEARSAWQTAREPMADVKAIPGRRFDRLTAAWIVPAAESESVELLAERYGAEIRDLAIAAGYPADAAARIAELEKQLAAALRLADEYAAALEQVAA